jgi:hypothetical protein
MKKFIIHSTTLAIALSASQVFGQVPDTLPTATEVTAPSATASTDAAPSTNNNVKAAQDLGRLILVQGLGTFAINSNLTPDGTEFPQQGTSEEKADYIKNFTKNVSDIVTNILDGTPIPDNITPYLKTASSLLVVVTNAAAVTPVLKQFGFDPLIIPNESIERTIDGLKEFSDNISQKSIDKQSQIISILSEATKVPTDKDVKDIFKKGGSSINNLISNATTNLNPEKTTKDDLSKVKTSISAYANISALVMANSKEGSEAYKNASKNLMGILKTANTLEVGLPGLSIPQNVKDSAIQTLVKQNSGFSNSSSNERTESTAITPTTKPTTPTTTATPMHNKQQ